MTPNARILGIDPGLARCGWAVIERAAAPRLVAAGCLVTRPGPTEAQRLLTLQQRLLKIMQRYQPRALAIEKLYLTRNISTAMSVGQARGVALLVAAARHLPVQEFSPTAVKLAVAGDGRADKRQIAKMVIRLLRLNPAPRYDDTVDALAVALCGSQTRVLT